MLNTRLLTLALTMAFVLLLPQTASTQGLGAREDNTALQGTNLTYYPQPNFGQCQADCASNGNCKGFTWIQAGTYKAGDAAMCYLVSAVTGKSSARGHFSAVKGSGGTSLGAREDNTALQGTNLTYYQQPNFGQCQADCANNANCQGFTWIQAGTYNAGDAAMCYLLSAVTGRSSARGHFSAIKGGGGGGGGGGTLKGEWDLRCCNDELGWTLSITNQEGATFSGSFSANTGGGVVTNGRLRGNTIEFDRVFGSSRQHWSAQLVNDGGRLRMINGVWTGDYLDRYQGRNNWHAEKK